MSFAVQAGLSVVATVLAWVACCLGAWGLVGEQAVPSVFVAGMVSIPIGILLVLLFQVWGVGAAVLLLGAFLRVSLTLGAGLFAAWYWDCWNQPFFSTLAVIYLVNLIVETGFVYRQVVHGSK